jgi:hypothetical protein
VSRADDKRPIPPWILADALQDRITPASGRLRAAKAIRRHVTLSDFHHIADAVDAEDYSTHVLPRPPRLREYVGGLCLYGMILAVAWWAGRR